MDTRNWAVVTPLANEEKHFAAFVTELQKMLDLLKSGTVYFVVDKVSKDNTLHLCRMLSDRDPRFKVIWYPESRSLVSAYLRGLGEAYRHGHDIIIEMDAGMSHDPHAIPQFIGALKDGYDCAFGSRYVSGGTIEDAPLLRRFLSRSGTLLANILLGTRMHDMTSGYQGFTAGVVEKMLTYRFLSTAHFYQTEIRYLLRGHYYAEIPISYRSPSPRISMRSLANSLHVLLHYVVKRMTFNAAILK